MIEITNQIFAPNYFLYVLRRYKATTASAAKFWFKWYAGTVVFVLLLMLTSSRENIIAISWAERFFWALFAPIAFVILLLSLLSIPAYFMLWPKKWIYEDNAVKVVGPFSTRLLSYKHVSKVVMDSPYSAAVWFYDEARLLPRTTNWYGHTKQDWISFIDFLRHRIPEIDQMVSVTYRPSFQPIEEVLSPDEAYEFVKSLV